jgi:hypothetical protein
MIIIHRYEPDAAIHWLQFPDKPDAETRRIMKAAGWRFVGACAQWKHAGLLTPLPELPGYEYEEAGTVDHSEARTERYEELAEKAEARRREAHETADAIAGLIPFGQPILIGHHSEGRHRRDLDKIDRNMRAAIEEHEKAERLRHRAAGSQRQQKRKHDPGAISRRLEVARKSYELYKDAASAEGCRRRDLLAEEIKRLEAELEAAGGLPADQIQLEKGDIILINGHIQEIKRVNKTTLTCLSLNTFYANGEPWELHLHRSTFKCRIFTAQEWQELKAQGKATIETARARLKEEK